MSILGFSSKRTIAFAGLMVAVSWASVATAQGVSLKTPLSQASVPVATAEEPAVAHSEMVSLPEAKFWDTDGVVNSTAYSPDGRTVYLGGFFATMQSEREGGFLFDKLTGHFDTRTATPRIDGSVEAVTSDGQGGWYLGGSITGVNGSSRFGLAHLRANNTVNPNLVPEINGTVRALQLDASNHILYIGGDFTQVNGLIRNRMAAIDINTGQPTSWNPDADGPVRAFALHPEVGLIYVGGDFLTVGGQPHSLLAAISTANGLPTAVDYAVRDSVPDGRVNSLALDRVHNRLYLGGLFTYIGSLWQSRSDLAAIDLATGEATAWHPWPGGPYTGHSEVSAVLLDEQTGTLYASGIFERVQSNGVFVNRRKVAAFDTSTGVVTDFNLGSLICGDDCFYNPVIRALALDTTSNTLFIGGRLNQIASQPRYRVAALDSVTGQLKEWRTDIADDGANFYYEEVNALAVGPTSDYVFVGGVELQIRTPRRNLAAIDTRTGQPTPFSHDVMPAQNSSYNAVHSLILAENKLYVGGQFGFVSGQSRRSVAAIDVVTDQLTEWHPNDVEVVTIFSMALDSARNRIFVAGRFSSIGIGFGQVRRKVAAIDTISGAITPWSIEGYSGVGGACCAPGTPAVQTLLLDNVSNTLYLGGSFDLVGNQTRNKIAAVDVITGTVRPWNPGANGYVATMALDQATNLLYVGGDFTTIGGSNRNKLAAIDASTGAATGWDAGISGGYGNGTVNGLALDAQHRRLFVGGYFATIGAESRGRLAAIDLTSLAVTDWNPELRMGDGSQIDGSRIGSLAIDPARGRLYVGGQFGSPDLDQIDEAYKSHFAEFQLNDLGPMADFDENGIVEVPDIFAFLSAYFAGDMRADCDASGVLGIPDIFAFLTLYFEAI